MEKVLQVLMLEDDPADAGLIQKLLQRSGLNFAASVVSDERAFLQALDVTTYDVVLADNALPQYSSLEALQVIKKKNLFVSFILVTGTVSEEFAVNIIKQGADDYILKTNLTRLPAAITKAIENKQTQKEKHFAQLELQELNEQLRNLSAHLQNVREEEQTRIAREIHDELGQMLTMIKIKINSADKKMQRSIIEAKVNLAEAVKETDNLLKAIRKIVSGLRPTALDDLGLVPALEWHGREFANNTGMRVLFEYDDEQLKIEKNISTTLYRIYQESLTNIAKHSSATEVKAELRFQENNIYLSVSDNGKGFDPGEIKSKKTFGLLGIRERLLLINGEMTLNSAPGKGTRLMVRIPGHVHG
jgi:signal transduction histidine kinase